MSERSEKQLSRAERVVNTPQISRPALFDWIEDKFRGKDARPNFFYLRQAFGRSGSQYLPDIIYEKEFKPNSKEPERAEMVTIANKIFAVAQDHCRELGRPALYVVHAISHEKGAAPYGGHLMRLRPIAMNGDDLLGGGGGGGAGGDAGDDEVQSDAVNRQRLLDQSLEHQRSNDEHARFMQDGFQKSTSSVIALQQEIIRELRLENQTLKSQQLDWWKAIQAAEDKSLEREMQRTNNKIKAELLERGAGLVMQMIPVVAKSLDRNKNGGALPANGHTIEESAESISIRQFVAGLSEAQRTAVLGSFEEGTNKYIPGLFSAQQVKIFADVAELKLPASALEALLPNGAYAITMEQIAAVQNVVPMEQLMPLYAMISKSAHDKEEDQQ